MGAADAYLQGGALLVLIGFASIVIRTLYLDNKELREHVDALTEASRALLTKYQDRDQEELRELRRQQQHPSEERR